MIFRFGSYALDAERRDLLRSGKRVALERQVFDILLYLLENRHRVVTRAMCCARCGAAGSCPNRR